MITITSQPPDKAFSRNPLIFVAETSALLTTPGLNITASILFNGVQVLLLALMPDNAGQVIIDCKTVADSQLIFANPSTSIIKNLSSQVGVLSVIFSEVTIAVPVDPDPQTSDDVLVFKAGLSYQLWQADFFTKYTDTRKYYFTWFKSGREVATWQKLYLNYLHTTITNASVVLYAVVTYTDGTTLNKTFPVFPSNTITENNLYRIAAGFDALRLQFLDPTKEAWFYDISIKDTGTGLPVYPAFQFKLDHTQDYDKIELNYQGSLGTLESLRLTGEHDANEDRESLSAELYTNGVTEPAYLPPAYITTGIALRESYKSNIGWCDLISAQEMRRDLFYSQQIWRYVKKRFWPVDILNKSIGRGRLSAQVREMDVEWAYNFKNVNYSPEDVFLETPLRAVDDAYEVYKNDVLIVLSTGVISNDEDENPDTLTVVPGTFATLHGSITLTDDGGFTYTPDADYIGPDSYTYTLVNQYGETDTAIINITVKEMEAGIIVMWSGSPGAVPSGWALCNGAGGTPDLKGRFIVGYDPTDPDYDTIGNPGGEKTHTLTIPEMPAHSHTYSKTGSGGSFGDNANNQSNSDDNTSTVGGGLPHENRPPYYTLAYIVKL